MVNVFALLEMVGALTCGGEMVIFSLALSSLMFSLKRIVIFCLLTLVAASAGSLRTSTGGVSS